ncbi:MAG TPA: RNA 2',3'-cyclic phosphodiesterase [Steroidobacteraceae bacterium]|jgi:2'-5' RNA ligase|nr:RNA 2',3'-cyclic phosphodiesterase [Steroidobacteraceae bacterium]
MPRGGLGVQPLARRRLFFALWPDDACRERLAAAAQQAFSADGPRAGRLVPAADWHVTLCFLGAVQEPLLGPLQAGAARLRAPAFTLRFEWLRYWEPAGVLALLGDCPPEAVALATALRTLSRELGVAPDDKPLWPHITLVRGLRGARQMPREKTLGLTLAATHFGLAESREHVAAPAARYRLLAVWPLEGRGG